jgi:hypothetical protein
MLTKTAKVIFGLSLLSAGYVMADTTTVCSKDSEQRSVSVVYSNAGNQVPCEVQYKKSSGTQTLWNYQNETGKCEAKASEFVAKLQGWGWACNEQAAAPVPNPAMIEDSAQPAQ